MNATRETELTSAVHAARTVIGRRAVLSMSMLSARRKNGDRQTCGVIYEHAVVSCHGDLSRGEYFEQV